MKQETIERLRKKVDEMCPCSACKTPANSGVSLTEYRDILAVLEAAQRWAEERTRVDTLLDTTGMAMTGELGLRADALLALIDLGGTK